MRSARQFATTVVALVVAGTCLYAAPATNTFTVAAYNIENWLLMDRDGQPNQPKPAKEKEAVYSVVAKVRPDVLSVEEMGTTNELAELADGLRAHGVDLPYREWIQGADPTRHVSVLSRFPIVGRFSRTDYTYDLAGQPTRIERGIIDVKIQVNEHYTLRAVAAHLKSKRQVKTGDQATMRLEEAKLLRAHVGKALKGEPELKMIVMGDFNDTPESEPIRAVIGEAPFALFDLMPVDSKGGHDTHYWKYRNLFSRIDYLITSPALHADYVEGSAHIADVPEWNDASDHRAIYATFRAGDASAGGTTVSSPDIFSDRRLWLVTLNIVTVLVVGGVVIAFVRRHYRTPSSRGS